jgi:polyisoprenoid-binding protein YceI
MKLVACTFVAAGLAGLLASFSAPVAAPVRAAEAYTVDALHSAVTFHTLHLGLARADGRFNTIDVEKSALTWSEDPAQCSILLVVQAASVDTADAKRDEHLRGPDFFSAKEFPEIVFESTKVAAGAGGELEMAGELTFHGVTRPVTATARKVGSGEAFGGFRAGFVAELTIDMREFGLAFLQKNPSAVGPEVTITVALECVRS